MNLQLLRSEKDYEANEDMELEIKDVVEEDG